jgi:hypothetical protein
VLLGLSDGEIERGLSETHGLRASAPPWIPVPEVGE